MEELKWSQVKETLENYISEKVNFKFNLKEIVIDEDLDNNLIEKNQRKSRHCRINPVTGKLSCY